MSPVLSACYDAASERLRRSTGATSRKRPALRDAITEYLDNSKEKISKTPRRRRREREGGSGRSFAEMVARHQQARTASIVIFLLCSFLTREVCQAVCQPGRRHVVQGKPFHPVPVRQIAVICEDYDALTAASHGGRGGKLDSVAELEELVGIATVKDKGQGDGEFRPRPAAPHRGRAQLDSHQLSLPLHRQSGHGQNDGRPLMGRIYKSLVF